MKLTEMDQYIRDIGLKRDKIDSYDKYPFCLETVKSLRTLKLHPNVTFLVGENGSGKSTMIEAIAVACGFNPEGGSKNFNFSTNDSHSDLYEYIKIVKGVKRPRYNFFLSAESFYNVASNLDKMAKEDGRALEMYGFKSLHEQSHGESFLAVFQNRFQPKGLYILDEPEAALSPTRQMTLLTLINNLVNHESQFIIATHSPILMAYPDSIIYEINNGYQKVEYEKTEHYNITRTFLNNREKMLNILFEDENKKGEDRDEL